MEEEETEITNFLASAYDSYLTYQICQTSKTDEEIKDKYQTNHQINTNQVTTKGLASRIAFSCECYLKYLILKEKAYKKNTLYDDITLEIEKAKLNDEEKETIKGIFKNIFNDELNNPTIGEVLDNLLDETKLNDNTTIRNKIESANGSQIDKNTKSTIYNNININYFKDFNGNIDLKGKDKETKNIIKQEINKIYDYILIDCNNENGIDGFLKRRYSHSLHDLIIGYLSNDYMENQEKQDMLSIFYNTIYANNTAQDNSSDYSFKNKSIGYQAIILQEISAISTIDDAFSTFRYKLEDRDTPCYFHTLECLVKSLKYTVDKKRGLNTENNVEDELTKIANDCKDEFIKLVNLLEKPFFEGAIDKELQEENPPANEMPEKASKMQDEAEKYIYNPKTGSCLILALARLYELHHDKNNDNVFLAITQETIGGEDYKHVSICYKDDTNGLWSIEDDVDNIKNNR